MTKYLGDKITTITYTNAYPHLSGEISNHIEPFNRVHTRSAGRKEDIALFSSISMRHREMKSGSFLFVIPAAAAVIVVVIVVKCVILFTFFLFMRSPALSLHHSDNTKEMFDSCVCLCLDNNAYW